MKTFRQITALSLMISSMLFITPATASTPVQKDSPVINTLFAQTKPQCIGRYVIDVPGSFNNQLHDMIFIDDFKIESKPLYPPAFKQRVQLREQALRDAINKPENESVNAPFIKEKIVLPDDKGIIFDRNISGEDDLGRVLEAHVFVNMTAFIITTDILDLSSPKYIERKKTYIKAGFTEAQMNEKPAKLAAMQSLISRLSGRKDEDIPSAKGVCIPNGFIRDDGSQHVEKITFSYENDDFILGVYTNSTYMGSDDTLFNRTAEIDNTLKIANQHTIRKYILSPGGVPAQAWLSGGPQTIENNINPLYEFDLYANEADATPAKPWLTIGINNFYKKTRYSEAQMIEIWDRLVNSLRYK
ncbi:T6SS immunity protein Tli4 family protein [Citrobacter braakii]|uniref:T6SS immunity protein Tli4 family protein n=2 Tax=Citrobacter braakii TaxID=57706 RepID=UPI0029E74C27|nr:T6SS immunity protein Tli4 family protein [Citrobacter braakii]MDL4386237.1 T6SS immunity protein Tli4 family protein [Citrobacter braakii]